MDRADPPSQADDDFQRELAARRKDLEREFNDKSRELKAQHQRRLDALHQEQADWEEHKRAKTKDLADREEKLRKHEERARGDARKVAATRDDLQMRKRHVEDLEAAKRDAEAVQAALQERIDAAEKRSSASHRTALQMGFVGILGPAAALLADRFGGSTAAAFILWGTIGAAVLLLATRVDWTGR
jgi:chromosome segregation ATPase